MGLVRNKIENVIEEKILTCLITSDEYCRIVIPILKFDYFQVDYIKKIVKWCVEYFGIYEKAPNLALQDIYEFEKVNLNESELDLIAIFLNKLSVTYREQEKLNLEYFLDKTKKYFKKRMIRSIAERIIVHTDRDQVEEAEDELTGYIKVMPDVSKWISLYGDKDFRRSVLSPERQLSKELFKFPGQLGELLGMFKRGQSVCVLGVFKKGKSWMLQEFATVSSKERCKVAYVSLEMDETEVGERFFKEEMSAPLFDQDILYPMFDCRRNQEVTCSLPFRTNSVRLNMNAESELLKLYNRYREYIPCIHCRTPKQPDYIPAVWYQSIYRQGITLPDIDKKLDSIVRMYGDNIYLITYPMYSVGLKRVETDVNKLEYEKGITIDVLLIDYPNLLAPDNKQLSKVERVDETWKNMKRIASSRRCLVVGPHQSTRVGTKKKSLEEEDISGFIEILGHVDKTISVNQSDQEKERGIARVGVLGSRDRKFSKIQQAMILQNLDVGQVVLDSELVIEKKKNNENSEEE